MEKAQLRVFNYVLWIFWLYKTWEGLFSRENNLLSDKEQNGETLQKSQSLTKNVTVDQKVNCWPRKSKLDKKVAIRQESRWLTRKVQEMTICLNIYLYKITSGKTEFFTDKKLCLRSKNHPRKSSTLSWTIGQSGFLK